MKILKWLYKGMITGLPSLTYNPLRLNTFIAPFEVKPFSTYINFKLTPNQVDHINTYLTNYGQDQKLIPTYVHGEEKEDFFLSVNIYNCSSPVFDVFAKESSRCEINTYIYNKKFGNGTVIVDYTSNALSMDPVNIFKQPEFTMFHKVNNTMYCQSRNKNINLNLKYKISDKDKKSKIDKDLIRLTDKIFYANGIFDKLYYDDSLINADIYNPINVRKISFSFLDLKFDDPDSIFYFKDEIRFAGGLWENLYKS